MNYCVCKTAFFWNAYKKSHKFSRLLVFGNKAISQGHTLNVSKTRFLEVIFHRQPSWDLRDVLLQELYLHSKYVLNHCF